MEHLFSADWPPHQKHLRQEYDEFDRKNQRRHLAHTLRTYNPESELTIKISACGIKDADQRTSYCRSPACPVCAHQYGKRIATNVLVEDAWKNIPDDELGYLTIIDGVTTDLNEVLSISKKNRRNKLRPLVKAINAELEAFHISPRGMKAPNLQIVAQMEIYAIEPRQFAFLSVRKRGLLSSLGADFEAGKTIFVVHFHALVIFDGAAAIGFREIFRDRIGRLFPGSHRVQLDCMRSYQTRDQQLTGIFVYGAKGGYYYDPEYRKRAWLSPETELELARWRHEIGRGATRFRIGYTDRPSKLVIAARRAQVAVDRKRRPKDTAEIVPAPEQLYGSTIRTPSPAASIKAASSIIEKLNLGPYIELTIRPPAIPIDPRQLRIDRIRVDLTDDCLSDIVARIKAACWSPQIGNDTTHPPWR